MDIDSVLKDHGVGIGGNNIKSIQRGSVTILASELSKTVTISEVDISSCLCFVTTQFNGSYAKQNLISISLLNSTTLTLTKGATGAQSTVSWCVIEFNNVKSFQTGTFTQSATEQSITVSSVNPSKSIVVASAKTMSNGYDIYSYYYEIKVVDSTTINFKSVNAVFIPTWQLIEFK